jgi:hypothetical protein|tara:strand:+ start:732 stop:1031 length:300 start_codon:yes stop_codon:yes gene_type:complete
MVTGTRVSAGTSLLDAARVDRRAFDHRCARDASRDARLARVGRAENTHEGARVAIVVVTTTRRRARRRTVRRILMNSRRRDTASRATTRLAAMPPLVER